MEFLAPLIVSAFAQTQPNQWVRFAAQDDGRTTQRRLILPQDDAISEPVPLSISPAQDDARPSSLTLSFSPAQALVHADTPQYWMIIQPEQPRVAIAIDALGQLSTTSPPLPATDLQ